MQIIVVPFMLPLLLALGVDLIWFGVFVIVLIETGTLTPPFGLHMFILMGALGISYREVVIGSAPFTVLWVAGALVLILFPSIATWLPNMIF